MYEAAGISRARVRGLLEVELKWLQAYEFPLRAIRNSGNNVGSDEGLSR